LLNFILDGLHEDLNRVLVKPIVPQIECEGLNDEKDAEESWQNHRKRNQSVIVDLMHGQFKSTVRCPDCGKLSITFDPYMSVSLPIPEIKIVEKEYYWVPWETSKRCVKGWFRLKSHEQVKKLRKLIAGLHEVSQEQFELVVIQDDQVRRILPRYEQVNALSPNNIFIFAVETKPESFYHHKMLGRGAVGGGAGYESQVFSSQQLEDEDGFASDHNPHNNSDFVNTSSNALDLNDKKGATELSKKLRPGWTQVILNFQIFNFSREGQQ
jgi:hypothetical protein